MNKSGILLFILTLCLFQEVQGQYYVLFTSNKDGKAIPDLSVHMTLLPANAAPVYGFYITENNGMIQVPDTGNYLIQIHYPGFKTFQDTLYLNHTRPTPLRVQLQELEFDLGEAVVTGEFEIKTRDQSLNKVRVIDRKRIERQGAVNLKDLLSNELNIRLNTDPELGTGLSLQGISGQNIKILIDGVPVIGRTDGTIDLSQINLANIERVEIIEGPMSVMYGSDALGGVINLITKKGTSHTTEVGVNSYVESNGTYNFDGRVGFRKKGAHLQISGGRNFFEGQSIGEEVRSKTWKPRMQYFGDITAGLKYKNSLHRLQSSYFWEKLSNKSEPVFTPYAIYARDAYYYTERISNGIFSDFRINPNTTFNSIINYSTFRRVKASYRKDLVRLSQVPINETDAQDTAKFSLWLFRGIYTHRFNPHISLQAGYDINLEQGEGERLEGFKQEIQDYAVFSSAEWTIGTRWILKPGVRFIYNSRYGAPVVPAFNMKYDITSWFHVRASYARGFRAPSLKELSLYFVDVNHNIQGNTDLKAEQSDNINLSFSMVGKWNGWNVKLEPSLFRNHLYDMINLAVVDPQQQLYRYVNIESFSTQGLAINGEARREGLSLAAGYAVTGRYSQFASSKFVYSPEYRLNASYTVPRIMMDVSVFYKFTGATPGFAVDENQQVFQTMVQSYQTLDATLSKSFLKRKITCVLGAKNLFNITNINYSGSAGGVHSGGSSNLPVNQGRTFFVNLRFNLIQMK